jgi:alkylation response protein AidB-like acyl-CoA dehydrogenase
MSVLAPPGGAFCFALADAESIFTPEALPADVQIMSRSVDEFMRKEVAAARKDAEAHDAAAMRRLMQQAGELGLTGATLPESFGGLGLPRTVAARLTESTAADLSFAISLSVHSGVAALPLLYFGSEALKKRYLPEIASGSNVAAFALSEANSGSDALAAQTRAVRGADGGYMLTGSKMWITNAGFADLFTVFAQLEGSGFTAFLVPRDSEGLTIGPEEHKMGLNGSSTCRVVLDGVQVPAEMRIGDEGQGHRPALYALNIGRLNIGIIALGACKALLRIATEYAMARSQFGRPIIEFGLIQAKLAEMAARTYLLESMIYRTCGYFDARAHAPDAGEEASRESAEEYAIEASVIKVYGTEALAYCADEALQIHGGFGFSEEFPVARFYRDARVFRIFEGTNEINRLGVSDQLLRRIERDRLSLPVNNTTLPDAPHSLVTDLRASLVSLLHALRACDAERRREHQEAAAAIADAVTEIYAIESGALRAAELARTSRMAQSEWAGMAVEWASLSHDLLPRLHHAQDEVALGTESPATGRSGLAREIVRSLMAYGGYPL